MNTSTPSPRISVVLAARDEERFLATAIASVLRQGERDLELVVVDDGSRDRTPEILATTSDPRLVVLRNEEPAGLAAALNQALDRAGGRYVARLDADDVALPDRLERQLAALEASPGLGIVGSGVLELDEAGRIGAAQLMPETPLAVRWHALFSSPFYHPSVLVDRDLLDRHGLRYDPRFLESEDYDLWTRLLALADGANVPAPLLLYRVHPGQASQRRSGLQRSFQLEVALREIAAVAPELGPEAAELAWRVGFGQHLAPDREADAIDAYLVLAAAFVRARTASAEPMAARRLAARPLARLALRSGDAARTRAVREALALDPALPLAEAVARSRRWSAGRARREAGGWLDSLRDAGRSEPVPVRVAVVSPEPTPYRSPLFDLLAARPDLDLTVLYAARTVAGRTWSVEPRHRAVFLAGARLPGVRPILRHDYPVTPGVWRDLSGLRPEVVVVSGWSTFASQAALVWCRTHHLPYVLLVESHDAGPRPGWRRAVKGTVVPPIVRGAASVLAVGSLARESAIGLGASPERVRVFANTVDVAAFGTRADELARRRSELRAALGATDGDVVVLSVARLAPEKGLATLVRAVAEAGDPRLVLAVAGSGPERQLLEALARQLGVRLHLGEVPWERVAEVYAAADVFALLSEHEPWGVVVNEAAACGLPLVLSDRVGAARDLLADGENGALVPAGDTASVASALRRLAGDPAARAAAGARSRELVRAWGYEPSVEGFVAAVREAARR